MTDDHSLPRRPRILALTFAAFVAPLLAIYAPLGMAPLLAVVAAVLALDLIAERRAVRLPWPALAAAVSLMLWGAASTLWTINPKGAWVTLGQVSGFVLCALIAFVAARAADHRPIARALLAGILVALAIFAIERLFGAPILTLLKHRDPEIPGLYSAYNRGLAVLIVLLPTALIAFHRSHPWLCLGLAGATVAITARYEGAAMTLAALAACAVFAAALSGPWFVRTVGVVAALAILAAPFVANGLITPRLVQMASQGSEGVSGQHRLLIWQFAAGRIMDKPLLGWGLDASRVMPGGKDKLELHTQSCQAPCAIAGERLPLHPHNMALQLWLELGVIGAAIGAVIVLGIFWLIAATSVPRLERALLAAQAGAGLVIAGLSYGVWQIWWLSTLALAAVLSTALLNRRSPDASATDQTDRT